mmetsp:Transcript_113697/g.361232  ORF Transcript_113697/g.361232 Transcript_113697/m.361232 type:complete len:319 (+) Transcript_113697:808-1764(+)
MSRNSLVAGLIDAQSRLLLCGVDTNGKCAHVLGCCRRLDLAARVCGADSHDGRCRLFHAALVHAQPGLLLRCVHTDGVRAHVPGSCRLLDLATCPFPSHCTAHLARTCRDHGCSKRERRCTAHPGRTCRNHGCSRSRGSFIARLVDTQPRLLLSRVYTNGEGAHVLGGCRRLDLATSVSKPSGTAHHGCCSSLVARFIEAKPGLLLRSVHTDGVRAHVFGACRLLDLAARPRRTHGAAHHGRRPGRTHDDGGLRWCRRGGAPAARLVDAQPCLLLGRVHQTRPSTHVLGACRLFDLAARPCGPDHHACEASVKLGFGI